MDTYFEGIILEDNDTVRYDDEGTPALLSKRSETVLGVPAVTAVMWRSHERAGNGGSRPVVDFIGDDDGTATSGTATTLVDSGASFTAAYIGGHVLILDGTGAGQIRVVSAVPDAATLTVGTAWTTAPDDTSVYVAAESGDDIVAVAEDSAAWLEESTTILGFAQFQRAADVLDIRTGARLMPSTHNFPSADNQAFNSIGTDGTKGNIAYYSSGFSRKRQDASDKLLPMDGTVANPLVVVGGTVTGATAGTLASTGAFTALTLDAPAHNFRYDNPTLQGAEYIVTIIGGTGYRQSRRIASNDNDTLTLEFDWGVTPDPGDLFEVYEIVAMPEAINPSEGYLGNWNNKAATADDGDNFGRNHRVAFILEQLAADSSWDRDKQRQLNKSVAGLDGKGQFGRYLVPRLREAVDSVGNGGNTDIDTVLAALEAHNAAPLLGRNLVDPVLETELAGEIAFLNSLISTLSTAIYTDELTGAVSTPGGSRGLAMVLHAIDTAAADVTGSYTQEYAGDYFNGTSWETVVRDAFSPAATAGIPAPGARPDDNYAHPLSAIHSSLEFEGTPVGNRGTWEQIVEVGDTVNGEFIFPLGQSGFIEGTVLAVTEIDEHTDDLSPIWRDWRFLPMLHISQDLAASADGDTDADGVPDGFERWYFGGIGVDGDENSDGDESTLAEEYAVGSDPTDDDTDDDGLVDGVDGLDQDRLSSGFSKLVAKFIKPPKPGKHSFKLSGKFGTGTPSFDPTTEELILTVTTFPAGDVAYTATVPAGTIPDDVPDGLKFKFKDKAGTHDSLAQVQVKFGKSATKPAKIKIKTIKTDLPDAEKKGTLMDLEITVGTRVLANHGFWLVKGNTLGVKKKK